MRRRPTIAVAWTRREVLFTLASAASISSPAIAQTDTGWKPTRPIKLVIPFAPGGTADILARYISPSLGEKMGQSVIVENKPGATGTIANQYVDAAPPDGTVLAVGVTDNLSIAPHVIKTAKTDVTKFVPIAGLGFTPFVLLGRPDLPANNLQELLALMRKTPLSYASAGPGSSPQMMALAFTRAVKIDTALHIPFNGMAPALQALLANQVDMALIVVGGSAQFRGKLKFYGIASQARMPIVPDVPTLTEQGLPLQGGVWVGLLAPPKTPDHITATLWKAIAEITSRPDYQAKLRELGVAALPGTQAEFAKFYQAESQKWGELVREGNVKVD
jgi:tripartite-type tricarboxylate transporter receptor subunit TctC